ncbi:MAG: hypothetical protein BWX95_02111 [Bacteroidetes bacterium ADurb.Bin141]|nr:MAG: hypothetical protein UZ10_BCD003002194 [Bacteroidetes bacterium OLB10]MBV6455007.1 hypothetical protein [Bacteroidia bacterium]MBX3106460.1 hypothetical protein [Bacteroidota bacterium]MCE7955086.1 hypothetical protein [Bacteroidetes bacterium CHB6]OQB60748.1 MAG: hypothetical protein BWX95_02111 [Bacteroidetes bacterium ADurb.Bin141]
MSDKGYLAGCCNIGEKEVRVRQKFLFLFLFISVLLTIAVRLACAKWLAVLLMITSFATVVLFIEVLTRFCILFAFFSLYNFKELGNLENVDDHHCHKKDVVRATILVLGSLALSLIYTWIVYRISC